MPNKTISLPDEVMHIIDSLDQPFSNWVRDELLKRRARQRQEHGRWERIEAMAQELAGEIDWLTVNELRAGGDDVR
jgi:hypothetical protein